MDENFCYICLATDVRIFAFVKTEPKQFLENIFKENGYHQVLVENPNICYRCKALLEKTFQFVQKALRAQKILHEAHIESSEITLDRIKAINRQEFGLGGNLSVDKINFDIFPTHHEVKHSTLLKCLKNKITEYEPMENKPEENSSTQYVHRPEENSSIRYESIGGRLIENNYVEYEPMKNELVENNSMEHEHLENRLEGGIDEPLVHECNSEIDTSEIADPLDVKPNDNVSFNADTYSRPHTTLPDAVKSKSINEATSNIKNNAHSITTVINIDDSASDDIKESFEKRLAKIKTKNRKRKLIRKRNTTLGDVVKSKSINEATSNIRNNAHSTTPVITIDDSASDDNNDIKESKRRKRLPKIKTKKRKRKLVKKHNETPPAKVKTKNGPYVPSAFILSLASFNETKRQRNKTKYVYSDDSDNSVSRKGKKSIKENEIMDIEFEPECSSDSDDSMYDVYDDKGRRMRKRDNRVFPLKCDDCEAEITSKKQHHYHYMTIHPKLEYPYRQRNKRNLLCQFCGHVSHTQTLLKAHEETHNSEAAYPCQECPKTFKNSIRLYKHLKRTHNKTLMECDYCGKKFQTRIDIRRHIRIHTGDKPYKCHICGYGFAHKGNIGIHIRYKHQGEPFVFNKHKKIRKKKTSNCLPVEEENDEEPLINIKKGGRPKGKATKAKLKAKKRKTNNRKAYSECSDSKEMEL